MDFTFSEDQVELRALVREYLESRSDESAVRAAMATSDGFDAELWRGIAEEIGVQGLTVPEEQGGLGLGSIELGIVMEELGRSLSCVPYFSTVVLAATALQAAKNAEADALLAEVAAGSITATVVGGERRGELDTASARGTHAGGGWIVKGELEYVLDGHVADVLLIAANTGEQLSLFAVRRDVSEVSVEALSMMDQTRRFATIALDDAPATLIAVDALPIVSRVRDVALASLAAEQIGGADRCLELAVEYAKTRFQFGRPIGSFQAIKHKCADMLIRIEAARAATAYALWTLDNEPAEAPAAAAMAKATASDAYLQAAGDMIQIHGGIGFTWEHPAHLYFKRAKSSELWLGDAAYHRERLGRILQLVPA